MSTKTLITAKINPDLDGLACIYAYSKLLNIQGRKAKGVVYGEPQIEAQYLIDRFKIADINLTLDEQFDEVVLVDASSMKGMPEVVSPDKVIEVIDHRETPTVKEEFPQAKVQIDQIGAAATIVVERYQEAKIVPDLNSSILLYCAIHSNTLNLRTGNFSERDQKAINWLKERSDIPDGVVRDMFEAKTKAILENPKNVLVSDFKEVETCLGLVGIGQLEMLNLQEMMDKHKDALLEALEIIKVEKRLSSCLITTVDLEKPIHIILTSDKVIQKHLEGKLGVTFKDNIAKRDKLMLRKELIPLLQ